MKLLVVAGGVLLFLSASNSHLILNKNKVKSRFVRQSGDVCSHADVGEPLILTPYLNEGKIDQAREASSVTPLVGNGQSYAGFFTVDKTYDSNLYFWYFPAEQAPETAPVILWLQGGPGGSSLYGLFEENGPYIIDKHGLIQLRDIYWSKTMHIIYIDNPVGTGFSFTRDQAGYSPDDFTIGKNLYSALQQFFTIFPELRPNDFFISGESYAGKYIPALGFTIHSNNPTAIDKINLKGMTIGNGMTDPINQLDYGSYLHGIGLIDEIQKRKFDELQNYTLNMINSEDWWNAFMAYGSIVGGPNSLFYNTTGYEYVYNYLISDDIGIDSNYVKFLDGESIRKNIHVGNLSYEMLSSEVSDALIEDFTKSVAPWISTLADHYRILMYNGELDIIVAYSLTANHLDNLKWCGDDDFAYAQRNQWRVGGELAGYIKTSSPSYCEGSLSLVMVRKAGHSVIHDQPFWAYTLMTNFINKLEEFGKPRLMI